MAGSAAVMRLVLGIFGKRSNSPSKDQRPKDKIAQDAEQIAEEERLRSKDPLYWARGRLVAIRPDGASKNFDPEKLRLIRTQAEHEELAVLLRDFWEHVQKRLRRKGDLRPEWLLAGPKQTETES
jgi:hypothetical protein